MTRGLRERARQGEGTGFYGVEEWDDDAELGEDETDDEGSAFYQTDTSLGPGPSAINLRFLFVIALLAAAIYFLMR